MVEEIHGEVFQADANDSLELRQEGDLVLRVECDGFGDTGVMIVGCARPEGDGERGARGGERDVDGSGRWSDRGKITGETKIVGFLAREFEAD